MTHPPVCNYEGSDYQSAFWERGQREYEDRVEAIALRRLLPRTGRLLLELGAGAGRNTARYAGFNRIVLVDYSRTQLLQAQARLGTGDRYIYVAADIYHLPFLSGLFDAATMIRTLHHMADAPRALREAQSTLTTGSTFVLEFANKHNLKAIARYMLRMQDWSPFSLQPVEFADLNFDFHPRSVRAWLEALHFRVDRVLTVSHFRSGLLKRALPTPVLVGADSLLQWTGALWQLTPSVFVKAVMCAPVKAMVTEDVLQWFKCPACGHWPLRKRDDSLGCLNCRRRWMIDQGIYDFRESASGRDAAWLAATST